MKAGSSIISDPPQQHGRETFINVTLNVGGKENSATYIRLGALVGYNVTFKVVRIGRWHEISSQFVRVIHTTNTHTAACKQTFLT